MAEVPYTAFASSLTPQQREYVNGYVEAKLQELVAPLVKNSAELLGNYTALQDTVATLLTQVESYESKFRDDSKYILTRGKIISFMKKAGIE